MDGYAVRSADVTQARRITGTIRMGHAPPGPLHRGEAMRIPTGGVLPPGADAVVPVEDAREQDEILNTSEPTAAGTYITPRGDDMAPGDVVLRAGRRVAAAEMSVLATLGRSGVFVYRRPRVAVLPTGDELVDVAQRPGTGQVRDSNRWAIAGALAALGADAVQMPRAGDELAALRDAIAGGLAAADGVFLTGGSSVGERDLTPDAVEAFDGPGVIVHGLRVKPGKPTVLAVIGAKPVIGLPGNPASALTILEAWCAR
jgi:molybdopterin molybdotransferase